MASPASAKKLRILNLNTNLYYDQDKLTKGMVDPADQFRWLEDRLSDARKKNISVSLQISLVQILHYLIYDCR